MLIYLTRLLVVSLLFLSFLLFPLIRGIKVTVTPSQLVRECTDTTIGMLLRTFKIVQDTVLLIVALLEYPQYNFKRRYEEICEPPERILLLRALYMDYSLHATLFGTLKLMSNPDLCQFDVGYAGNLLGWNCSFSRKFASRIPQCIVDHAVHNIRKMESRKFFKTLIFGLDDEKQCALMASMAKVMTTAIMELFLKVAIDTKQTLLEGAVSVFLNNCDTPERCHFHTTVVVLATSQFAPQSRKLPSLVQSEIFAKLIDSPEERDFSYWETLGYLALQILPNNAEPLYQVVQMAPVQMISPYLWKKLLLHYTRLDPTKTPHVLDLFPQSHIPFALYPLKERLDFWMRRAPFDDNDTEIPLSNNDEISLSNDDEISLSNNGEISFPNNGEISLPNNDEISLPNDGEISLSNDVSELIGHYFVMNTLPRNKSINRVSFDVTVVGTLKKLLESGTFCRNKTQHTATALIAMYYMLAAGWKRDLSTLFPDFACNQSWRTTCTGISDKWSSVILKSLNKWKIMKHFSPAEFRSMLDSSFALDPRICEVTSKRPCWTKMTVY